MCDHPYRVGEALAYLVQRMGTFCSAQDGDVFMYEQGRRGIPKRTPATDVLRAMARNDSTTHGALYSDDQQEILDTGIGLLTDSEHAVNAREGFLYALSSP